ncbi:hypothetical protein [Streptomyces sp. NPDC090022]|uniref:hypothetical protein n=1 Tax=Streptomyces sp. NPDC090022 TaxID=3365920 RepID=UPI003807EC7F
MPIYRANTVHVPRQRALVDALAPLPDDQRERIARSETRLVDYLDRRARKGREDGDQSRFLSS